MQQLDHETSESFEGSWYTHAWIDFDQDAFGSVDKDLQPSGLVDGRIQERKQALNVEVS